MFPSATSEITARFAEKCLYEYKQNIAGLDMLRLDAQYAKDTVDVTIEERIQYLERVTQPITRLIADLTAPCVKPNSRQAELFKLLELLYFGRNSITAIMGVLHMSRRNVYNRRQELVNMAISYITPSTV